MSIVSGERPEQRMRRGRPRLRDPSETGNRTIAVGLDLFINVARMGGPATVTEIARSTGMSVTRASRYLSSLTLREFLRKDPETGRYDLGPAAIELSIATAARIDVIQLVLDVMRKLSAETKQVAVLCSWGPTGPMVIRWDYGELDLAIRIREGLKLSTVISASGRIFLAYCPPRKVLAAMQRDLKDWNKRAPADQRLSPTDVGTIQEEVRRHGLARGTAPLNPAVVAIAAPIFDKSGSLSMSLSLVGFSGALNTSYRSKEAGKLKAATEQLSRLLSAVSGTDAGGTIDRYVKNLNGRKA